MRHACRLTAAAPCTSMPIAQPPYTGHSFTRTRISIRQRSASNAGKSDWRHLSATAPPRIYFPPLDGRTGVGRETDCAAQLPPPRCHSTRRNRRQLEQCNAPILHPAAPRAGRQTDRLRRRDPASLRAAATAAPRDPYYLHVYCLSFCERWSRTGWVGFGCGVIRNSYAGSICGLGYALHYCLFLSCCDRKRQFMPCQGRMHAHATIFGLDVPHSL